MRTRGGNELSPAFRFSPVRTDNDHFMSGLTGLLATCDLDYLRACIRNLSAERRREIGRACRMSNDERLAKLQLAGHLAGKKWAASIPPEELRERALRAVAKRWPPGYVPRWPRKKGRSE